MVDTVTPQRRSEIMANIRSKDMRPEKLVRSTVYHLGYRFRLHRKDLPGKPDLVFPSRKKVIFVHGCFWHSHSDPNCKKAHIPKSNPNYWLPKLERTRKRDRQHIEQLNTLGWEVLVVWECKLENEKSLIERLRKFLE